MVEIELKSNELKEYVYLKLNKDRSTPIYDDDLESIEYLKLNGIDFLDEPTDATLYDLVFFKNLKRCIIMNKELTTEELQVLKRCENLVTIQFTNCKFPKETKYMFETESLIIDRCYGVCLDSFDEIITLTQLRIVNCEDINIKGIAKFKNITDLYLQNLILDDIDEIKELKQLQFLNLNGTKIKKKYKFDDKISIVHEDENYIYDN